MNRLFLLTMFGFFLLVSCGKEKSNTDQDFSTPSASETAAEPDLGPGGSAHYVDMLKLHPQLAPGEITQ